MMEHGLDYENVPMMRSIVAILEENCRDGERVIWRSPFRWKDKGGVLPNAYEMFSVEQVAAERDLEIVANFNHAAIVRAR